MENGAAKVPKDRRENREQGEQEDQRYVCFFYREPKVIFFYRGPKVIFFLSRTKGLFLVLNRPLPTDSKMTSN